MTKQNRLSVEALKWVGDKLQVLDQRKVPEQIVYQDCGEAEGVGDAIASMRVRGAPAIGIAAAYGVVLSVMRHVAENAADWRAKVDADIDMLAKSRPTAVNLFWALGRMKAVLDASHADPLAAVLAEAEKIHADDIAANRAMGERGADLIDGAKGVLTHCNAGALATGGYGTALSVIRSLYARQPVKVYADETRPWLQGARLTVWELSQDGIPATLIADSAAAWLMRSGAIDWVIVGADRIAANGDAANKIGTYALAVLARQHGVKFMVVAPNSTIDWTIADGSRIEIEERDPAELLPACYREQQTLVNAWNPVFDVTPADLISAIVTESGVVLNPSAEGMARLRAF
ncbi:S-methyl-5-thioribose-1-phosphate isomerase [Methylomicrobium sp. Wu6]|uniref:S-methyl-5-thioribose-1-phosphate isomerase n=1 Tax=Methylomicrobium sp. Wu6 TaxID=3107928 RepID=UPI002DD65E62|nr:S-methyl-5-thioribose-1-phosphate isomerase [Methylomicrobium sp. Wu6]MEC4750399.1 S-methyl-5-thioribose-1-phosphate isomerase [Methylomicrobium sp. Wu6]